MSFEEIARKKTGNEAAKYILWSDYVDVGQGQRLFVLEWGKRGGKPFIELHGGPGQSFNESHVALFNGETDHVIFFDQRGCGESKPSAAALSEEETRIINTPFNIIEDIEKLREGRFEKVNVAGGSWGSTLALLYAIKHPDRVASLQLWSLYLGTKEETDNLFADQTEDPDFPFVAAWERFIAMVPQHERGDGGDGRANPRNVLEYYRRMVNSPDEAVARRFSEEYAIYEFTLCAPDDPGRIEADVRSDANAISAARIELLYLSNDIFVPDNYILDNIGELKGITITTAQGLKDRCTLIKFAHKFEEKLGRQCVIPVENAGHLRNDKKMAAVLKENMSRAPVPGEF